MTLIFSSGNLALYILLLQGHYELRVDLEDWEGNTTFAEYNYFKIHGPEQKFKLSVYGYSGSAGNCKCIFFKINGTDSQICILLQSQSTQKIEKRGDGPDKVETDIPERVQL